MKNMTDSQKSLLSVCCDCLSTVPVDVFEELPVSIHFSFKQIQSLHNLFLLIDFPFPFHLSGKATNILYNRFTWSCCRFSP